MQVTQPKKPLQYESTPKKFDTLCICQICTCGKHRCPPAGHLPFSGQSTYHHDYQPCTGIIQQFSKPCTTHYHQRHYTPNLLKTTYDAQFIPHKIENGSYQTNRYDYKKRFGKFYGETQYTKNYQPKQISRQKSQATCCCHHHTPKQTKFQSTTTYKSDYIPKVSQNTFNPKNYQYQPRKVPFQHQTTYNTQFIPHQIQPNMNCCSRCGNRCNCQYVPHKTGKFDGQSNYKQSYQPYEIERGHHCPVLDLPQYPRKCSPGKTHLNYSAEKNKWY